MTRALAVTDPHLAAIGLIDPVVEAIRAAGVEAEVFAESGIEPSERSVALAVEAAREGGFDGFVGLGGGSSIDTAKIAALLATHPGGIYDYLNPPIGKGTPVPGSAAAAVRRPHDRRHRCRGDDGRDHRPARSPRQERHLASPTCARCSASSTPT